MNTAYGLFPCICWIWSQEHIPPAFPALGDSTNVFFLIFTSLDFHTRIQPQSLPISLNLWNTWLQSLPLEHHQPPLCVVDESWFFQQSYHPTNSQWIWIYVAEYKRQVERYTLYLWLIQCKCEENSLKLFHKTHNLFNNCLPQHTINSIGNEPCLNYSWKYPPNTWVIRASIMIAK